MKKIDFHIHTIPTSSDAYFEYCLSTLAEYVRTAKLDAIAITNHNKFDLEQFKEISDALESIEVFPGIEVDVDSCHILVVSSKDNLANFNHICENIYDNREKTNASLSSEEFIKILGNFNDKLIIPHYQKPPNITPTTFEKLKNWITAGEVNSAKKFKKCLKNDNSLVPVIFSDTRIKKESDVFPIRQTYIDCGELTFSAIRDCLSKKDKVFLSEFDGNQLFPAQDNGLLISTGLNVLFGKRSSGKTYTLDRINEQVNRVKYIKQFSLVQSTPEADEAAFKKAISQQKQSVSNEFLFGFKSVMDEISEIDLSQLDLDIEAFINSLKKNASETHLQDVFSKATLFNESPFTIFESNALVELIQSTQHLIENLEFKEIIIKHIDLINLRNLACELIELLWKNEDENSDRLIVNSITSNIKSALAVESSATRIEDVNLLENKLERDKVGRFIEIVEFIRKEKTILNVEVQGFRILGKKMPFKTVGEIQKNIRGSPALSEAMNWYDEPFVFLKKLLSIDALDKSDVYKCFVSITYDVLNSDGFPVSGGQRSEFRLLQEIQDATKFDVLLIDEPESSFDNNFLKGNVNSIINSISKNMPVVVVTHNSTVGGSIGADYLLYASADIVDGAVEHRIYSGHPTDKKLVSVDGHEIPTHSVYMDSLEAGELAYNERKDTYESVKT